MIEYERLDIPLHALGSISNQVSHRHIYANY